MPTRFALSIAAVVVAAIIADRVLNGGEATLFLVRKLFDLVEYLSFRR
jgi:hypothetical protein